MSGYPFFIPKFVLCANSSLFCFKIANEHREFRNYLFFSTLYTKYYCLSFVYRKRSKEQHIIKVTFCIPLAACLTMEADFHRNPHHGHPCVGGFLPEDI